MKTPGLILKEIQYRRLNFALSTLALIAAVAWIVGYLHISEASLNETRRVTRDMGFNLRIIPRAADVDEFWIQGYTRETMPEDAIDRLAGYKDVFLSYNHLVGTLQQRTQIAGKDAIITGLSQTIAAKGKKPMGYAIAEGNVILGHRLAERLQTQKGDSVQILDHPFTVEQILVEKGTAEDITAFTSLSDAQTMLSLPGRINEIKAIDCLCLTTDQDPIQTLRAELEKALPEAQVFQIQHIADARAKHRQTAERLFALLTPFTLIVSAAWVGALAMINVRDRRSEIGILRAIGHGSGHIAGLFLGKACAIGLVGALAGSAIGIALARHFGPDIFYIATIQSNAEIFWKSLLWTPVFAAVASFIPTMAAVSQDPANSLKAD